MTSFGYIYTIISQLIHLKMTNQMEGSFEPIDFANTPFENCAIRITPNRQFASVIDVIKIVSNCSNARQVWATIKDEMFEIEKQPHNNKLVSFYQFIGKRQKNTPVVTAHGIIELLHLMPGKKIQQFRKYSDDEMVRMVRNKRRMLIDHTKMNLGNEGTLQAYFNRRLSDDEKDTCLKYYARKLEIDFEYKQKDLELGIDIATKRQALKLRNTEHCVRMAKRRKLDFHEQKLEIDHKYKEKDLLLAVKIDKMRAALKTSTVPTESVHVMV
jgi:hypothetical protein